MKSSMVKTTLREIKNSFGRYFAILAIVALGVGFFAGLMVTTPAMVKSGGEYMNGHELFDLRLLSTLGFEKSAVELLTGNDSVKAVEGAVSADFLAENDDGETRVMTAQTLLAVQNQLNLVAGRLPEAANECVVDSNIYSAADIGSAIRVSKGNAEETVQLFGYKEYEIVGVAQASYYVNYDRGTASLGNGKVVGFVYLLPEGFDSDYYTEIFVRLKQDYEVYSAEYEAAIDVLKDWAEPLAEAAALQRYDSILEEADEKIEDARKELDEKTAEAREELADAEKKIANGEEQLADAQEKIADGEEQLADAKREISRKTKELEDSAAQLADGRSQVEEGLAQIAQAKSEMQTAMGVTAGEQAASSAVGAESALSGLGVGDSAALAQQLQALDVQESVLLERLSEIEAGESQIAEGRRQLAQAQSEIADGEKQLEENREKLADAQKELEEGRKEYEDGQKELEEKTAEAEEKIAEAEEELKDLEEPDIYVLGRDTNIGYACFENDSAIVEGIAKVFPMFFFLVAALVCITTMNRMVEEQRTQIGVLKALGYSDAGIMGKYLFYSGSAAIAGCVAGFIAGCVAFPAVIWNSYRILYHLGEITLIFDWKLAAISLVVSVLCSMGTTWLTCRYELTSVAAQLIRPRSPKSGKRILLEHIPFLWKRLSFLVKVSIRNVLRYKRRFFMMVIGIGGCTALLVTGFGIKDSIADVATLQYEQIQRYDMGITLKDAFLEEESSVTETALLNRGKEYAIVCEKTMDLTGPQATKSVNVIIPKHTEEMTAFIDLHTQQGEPIAWPQKGGAVINTKLADKCGIRVGDLVTLRNEEGEKLTVEVTAVSQNFVYNYVYISPETWEADNGSAPEYKSIYLNAQDGTDLRALSEKLLACEEVSAISVNSDFLEQVSNMMGSLDYIVLLVVFCAGALAFIVIYNLTNINITERIREIATIKVLGFYPNETAAYVFRENIVLTAIGAAAGLVMGVFLHRYVMYQVDIDMITFDVRILPWSYGKSVLLTFVFMIIVDIAMYIKLERINMAESLKSIE